MIVLDGYVFDDAADSVNRKLMGSNAVVPRIGDLRNWNSSESADRCRHHTSANLACIVVAHNLDRPAVITTITLGSLTTQNERTQQ